ncbi:thyrotropin-releasing hormone receptor-like [Gigantopelta aegis]|uniref:thyrotropin-releasing hormone receptor-like n=1 Tax=Gigantopelta aegis TaxID=1735272 RepID=UPI001B888FAA|nr:thyrotropin-releasing hormone receptor-like [Gigantopelta aegis]
MKIMESSTSEYNITTSSEFTSNSCEYSNTTTQSNTAITLEDFLEYQISVQIHLYYLPVLLFIGIPGNAITFVVLVFSSFRKSTTSMYLAVISVLDTLILLVSAFWYANREVSQLDLINDVTCKLVFVVFYFSIHYNVLLVVAVTVERFIVVVFPLKAQLWISMRRTVVVIVCCGVFSFGLNLCHVFIRTAKVSRTTGKYFCGRTREPATKLFLEKAFPWIDSLLYCILPMMSLFALNTIMIHHMKKHISRCLSLRNSKTNENQSNQRQMTVMLLLVSFSFLLLTGPMGIVLIVERYVWIPRTLKQTAVSRLLHSVIDNMMYMNHAINFMFYCFTGRKFRNELKRMCCCFACKRRKSGVQQAISSVSG